MMAGISSKAAGGIQNKYKFNGGNELQSAEFSDGSGMELYDAVHRMYDPQLGRFWQVDELAEANWEMSTYCFASDNPLRFNDPLGLTDADPKDDPTGKMKETKTLQEVVVSSKIPKLDQNQVQSLYYALDKYGRGTDRIRNKTWRAQVEAYDATAKWLVKYHAGVKEDGMMMLDIASNFIPLGWVTKLRYVKYAAELFKFKRGAIVGRVFWSGGRDIAGKAAMDFAKAEGMQTLEMTLKGKVLEKLTDLTSYNFTKPLWDRASTSFARGAEGAVNVFHNAADGVSLTSTWTRIEYNILKENGNPINYIDVFK